MKTSLMTLIAVSLLSISAMAQEKNTQRKYEPDYIQIDWMSHGPIRLNLKMQYNSLIDRFPEKESKLFEMHQKIQLLANTKPSRDIWVTLHSPRLTITSKLKEQTSVLTLNKNSNSDIEVAKQWIHEAYTLYSDVYGLITEYAKPH